MDVRLPSRLTAHPRALRVAACTVGVAALAVLLARAAGRGAGPPVLAGVEVVAPALSPVSLEEAARRVAERAGRDYPGAAVALGIGPAVQHLAGYGHLEWKDTSPRVDPVTTMYDLASVTKAVATTTAVLLLADDGTISLDAPVQRWLPEFRGPWKEKVTWRHLLTHTSGVPPGTVMRGGSPEEVLTELMRRPLGAAPGVYVQYSDLGFALLFEAAERAAGEPLPRFLHRRVWSRLGMRHTRFAPGLDCTACAPTMLLRSGERFRGLPADWAARRLGDVAGNAGLFSSAADLGRFAAMIASGGQLNGVRILREETVRELFRQQPGAGRRTLGWTAFCPDEPFKESVACRNPVAYGHTGFSGTSLWIDPERGIWAVILTNRTYLQGEDPPPLEELRREVFARLTRQDGPGPLRGAAP